LVTRSNGIAQEEADPQISAARLLLGIAGALTHTGNPNGQMGMEGRQPRLHPSHGEAEDSESMTIEDSRSLKEENWAGRPVYETNENPRYPIPAKHGR
jgi:hypothetical protein